MMSIQLIDMKLMIMKEIVMSIQDIMIHKGGIGQLSYTYVSLLRLCSVWGFCLFLPFSRYVNLFLVARTHVCCCVFSFILDGEFIIELTGHSPRPVNSIAFSPDGKTIATGSSDATGRLWSAGKQLHSEQCG